MPSSPVKRVTRARTKAVEDEDVTKLAAAKARATKITTAGARATKSSSRQKHRADDDATHEEAAPDVTAQITEHEDVEEPKPAKATRGRRKATTSNSSRSTEDHAEVVAKTTEIAAPRPARGRPRKNSTNEIAPGQAVSKEDTSVGKRSTRTRGAAAAAKPPAPTKSTAARKKVTFQDIAEQDKENQFPSAKVPKKPSSSDAQQQPAGKQSGLRAKPVRRPAATRTTRRGKKTAEEDKHPHEVPLPLSPKKPTQITLGAAMDSDEDELSGSKTPLKVLNKSPLKPAGSAHGTAKKSVSVLDFTTSKLDKKFDGFSPSKLLGSSIMASPARRPSSPVKEQHVIQSGSPNTPDLGKSLAHPPLRPLTSPLKATIRSPARRPVPTPGKARMVATPAKGRTTDPASAMKTPSQVNTFNLPTTSSQKTLISAFRAAKSPQRTPKVHKMTFEELDAAAANDHETPMKPIPGSETPFKSTPGDKFRSNVHSSKIPVRMKSPPTSPKDAPDRDFSYSEPMVPSSASSREHQHGATTPPGSPPKPVQRSSFLAYPPDTHYQSDESDSEDELQTDNPHFSPVLMKQSEKTPKRTLRRQAAEGHLFEAAIDETAVVEQAQFVSLTPLARQFGNWQGASPDKRVLQRRLEKEADMFSLKKLEEFTATQQSALTFEGTAELSPVRSTFFDDEMSVREVEGGNLIDENDDPMIRFDDQAAEDDFYAAMAAQAARSFEAEPSEASQEYGDENALPIDPALLELDAISASEPAVGPATEPEPKAPVVTETCTPTKVFSRTPRVLHTVCKVPLRAAAEQSPTVQPMRRSKSFTAGLSPRKGVQASALSSSITTSSLAIANHTPEPVELSKTLSLEYTTPSKFPTTPKQGSGLWSNIVTPGRTPRPDLDAQLLKGAIVYVDVHTTEGADASGIFVDLLSQMGARCVKQWTWNPNSNASTSADDSSFVPEGTEAGKSGTPGGSRQTALETANSKIGITHVVFKDGGKRTLEKVRQSKGVVLCVGVAWVLDCERENRWLDESDYAIDLSMIPRGGHRRRKSMEPRALSNINGHLVPTDSPALKDVSATPISPTKEFLTFTPAPAAEHPSVPESEELSPDPATPFKLYAAMDNATDLSSEFGSPTTPAFLHPETLVQQTCPPKQIHAPLFPLTGNIEDQPDEVVRRRLLLARRKSLQWAPKVASPLGKRVFSWE